MGKTSIEWATDVWNPVTGCTKLSKGCKNCYAKSRHDMRHKAYQEGKGVPEQYSTSFETVRLHPNRLEIPLHWRQPRRIFVNSMSDLFHPDVPDEFIWRVFRAMTFGNRRHTYMVLTKRPARMKEWFDGYQEKFWHYHAPGEPQRKYVSVPWPDPCIWLGVSVEDQKAADERIPLLLQVPAAVRFVSCEPLLGPVDLSVYLGEKNEVKESGREGILRSEIRRVENRRGREYLASGSTQGRSVDREDAIDPMRPETSRTSFGEIPSGQGYVQPEKDARTGTSDGVVAFFRDDTGGNDNQPQERRYSGQSTGEFGVGDILRTGDPLDLYAGASEGEKRSRSILWVIAGGESGPNARPTHPDWFRSLRDQCQAASAPYFFKQWGEYHYDPLNSKEQGRVYMDATGKVFTDRGSDEDYRRGRLAFDRVGKKAAGRLLDGVEWNQFPEVP
jgi:protein gp37